MPIEINRVEYIDSEEVAKLLDFSSVGAFHAARSKQKHQRNHPFMGPDLIIENKFFWRIERIPDMLDWRNDRSH